MNGDVYVDGSINVRGSVIGSGPYIDTSDARFKTNITTINDALNIVTKLNGVSLRKLSYIFLIFLLLINYIFRLPMIIVGMNFQSITLIKHVKLDGLLMKYLILYLN